MGRSQRRYAPEFRRQMVDLHHAGRSFDELAKEFGCTSWSIRQWVKQAERDVGRGDGAGVLMQLGSASGRVPGVHSVAFVGRGK